MLAGEMTYTQSDSTGNAKRSGDKKDGACARLKLGSRASPEGVSCGWGLTDPLTTQS